VREKKVEMMFLERGNGSNIACVDWRIDASRSRSSSDRVWRTDSAEARVSSRDTRR